MLSHKKKKLGRRYFAEIMAYADYSALFAYTNLSHTNPFCIANSEKHWPLRKRK